MQIRVYCRIRPHSGTSCVRCLPDQSGLRIDVDGKEHSLEFDRVYGPMATQEEVRLLLLVGKIRWVDCRQPSLQSHLAALS